MLEAVANEIQFLLRLPREMHAALKRMAEQETRSLNAQIVHLLKTSESVKKELETSGDEPEKPP